MNGWCKGTLLDSETKNNCYEVIKEIGSGGCGINFLVKSLSSQEYLVIKTIKKNVDGTTTLLQDSLTKAFTTLIKLEHPNIVNVKDYEKIKSSDGNESNWCLVLEYIEGENLHDYVKEPLSEEEALKYIKQVGNALDYLHNLESTQIIHHDVKPANIMLRQDSDQVILIDFGTSRFYQQGKLGKNEHFYSPYFSPYDRVDIPATDVYSLAATLYFLLTKEFPTDANKRKEGSQLIPPIELNSKISERVNNAILKGMEMKSEDRSPSVQKWLELLEDEVIPSPPKPKYKYLKEERYSFITNANDRENTYYFALDKNNQPVELGNGNYGVVYLIHDGNGSIFALKILYEYDLSSLDLIIKQRFQAEITSSKNIQTSLPNIHSRTNIPGVVLTIDGASKFRELPSKAYETFKDVIDIERLSNYALVMELYDKTLEEVLENKIGKYAILPSELTHHKPLEQKIFKSELEAKKYINQEIHSEEEQRYLKSKIYELNGYDLLRNLNFDDRIDNILPFLEDITQGVKLLHQAGYLHLDLKPANIFIRIFEQNIECAIGDLGFLEIKQLEPKSLLGKYDSLPLGTLHYRSPEQNFFFDVANVEISNDPQKTLIIRDPIFKNTIIEKDDYVIFSKHNDKSYKIDSINIGEEKNAPVYVTLKFDENNKASLKPSKKSQAKFYKIQGKRTDLFGIGAIAFNLLTCGESPERFYESIRKYDTQNSPVENLVQQYENVFSFESSEPGWIKIFEPFQDKNSREYAPIQIIKLILKCMLYKSPDTFYNSTKGSGEEPTEILYKQIKNLTAKEK